MKVIFRKFEDDDFCGDGIIALFPEEIEGNGLINSYMSIGQHCIASVDLIQDLNICDSQEVAQGIKMLYDAGYTNLLISKGVHNV